MDREKIKKTVKEVLQFLFNPRLLLCVGLAWLITNGWSYITLALGTYFRIPWMIAVASTYMAFLWFPFTPEKIATVIIAMFLLKRLFPHDEKTLKKLRHMHSRYREKHRETLAGRRKDQKK